MYAYDVCQRDGRFHTKWFLKSKKIKILDSCCGNGNFHAYISTKTNISNLYFNEINPRRINNLEQYFGKNINLTIKDFLSFDAKEEFDCVVSNPPYAKFNEGKRISKNHNLSRDFIKKAVEITKPGGYILFIVPNNWMSFSDRNILPLELSKYQFIKLDVHGAKKWFPNVGSSFTWFLLQKAPNTKPVEIINNYVIKDTQYAFIDKNVKFIPLYYSETVRSILNKTINNSKLEKYKIETSSYLHKYTKSDQISILKNSKFKYKLIHTPSQAVWSCQKHKFHNGYKVFIPLTNQFVPFIDKNCGMTQSIAFIQCKTKKEANKIIKELNDPFYRCINNLTRYGNFNNVRVLQNLPILEKIKLTKSERDFIMNFNNQYYGEKKNNK